MKLLVFLALVVIPTVLQAQAPVGADSSVARELQVRVQLDQDVRELMTLRNRPGQRMPPEDILLVTTVDSLNTAWLEHLVETRGWPKQSEVGEEAAYNAWLLVQHADRDPAFQQEVLHLMKKAVAEGEASGSNYAFLADRVRVGRGEEQLYGTQMRLSASGELEPFPIEAPEQVDERRAAVGLPPLAEYIEQIRKSAGQSQ